VHAGERCRRPELLRVFTRRGARQVVNIEANEAKSARVLVEREQRACEATETEAQALEEQVRSGGLAAARTG
jgi:hypothetical protein